MTWKREYTDAKVFPFKTLFKSKPFVPGININYNARRLIGLYWLNSYRSSYLNRGQNVCTQRLKKMNVKKEFYQNISECETVLLIFF